MRTSTWARSRSIAALAMMAVGTVCSAEAATITFATPFSLTTHDEFDEDPDAPDGVGNSPRVEHFISDTPFGVNVPAFDTTLGTLTFLRIEVIGELSLSASVQFGQVAGHIDLIDPIGLIDRVAGITINQTCDTPCIVSNTVPVHWIVDLVDFGPLSYNLGESPDRSVTWEIASPGIIDSSYTGTAYAIYTYEPFEAIPEPTSLLLLATGLLPVAARLRKRRR
jgi:hypothetical protein